MKRTLSHSTVLVDGNSQPEAEGSLEFSESEFSSEISIVSAFLGNIWPNGKAKRTLIQIPEDKTNYVIDLFELYPNDTIPHDYFYVLHSTGDFAVTSGESLQNYPTTSLKFGKSSVKLKLSNL